MRNRLTGFTLIEMITVILILGILSVVLADILRGPMQSFINMERRAQLVDIAETALLRMTREIRLSLPNSIRVTGNSMEFLRTVDGGRYRAKPPPANRRLVFNNGAQGTNGTIHVLGGFINAGLISVSGAAASEADCLNGTTDCMVVYNTGQPGANAYNGDNVAAIQNINTAVSPPELTFIRSTGFPLPSPQQRFHIVDTPVSYICNTVTGEIRRFDGYTIGMAVAGPGNLLVDQVSACSFNYDAGNASRAALVTISLTLLDPNLGESITLLQQIHVSNVP